MRPDSIALFDRYYLASLMLSLIGGIVTYPDVLAELAADPAVAEIGMGAGFFIVSLAVGLMIALLLWYLISRRASTIAKWILVVMTAIGVIGFIPSFFSPLYGTLTFAITLATTALNVVAVYFLFRPDAREWLDSKGTSGSHHPGVFD